VSSVTAAVVHWTALCTMRLLLWCIELHCVPCDGCYSALDCIVCCVMAAVIGWC